MAGEVLPVRGPDAAVDFRESVSTTRGGARLWQRGGGAALECRGRASRGWRERMGAARTTGAYREAAWEAALAGGRCQSVMGGVGWAGEWVARAAERPDAVQPCREGVGDGIEAAAYERGAGAEAEAKTSSVQRWKRWRRALRDMCVAEGTTHAHAWGRGWLRRVRRGVGDGGGGAAFAAACARSRCTCARRLRRRRLAGGWGGRTRRLADTARRCDGGGG